MTLPPEADLLYLNAMDLEFSALLKRIQILACAVIWLLADDLGGRIFLPGVNSSVEDSESSWYGTISRFASKQNLHCAALCLVVMTAMGVVAVSSRAMVRRFLLAWVVSLTFVLAAWEFHLVAAWRGNADHFGVIAVQFFCLGLVCWTVFLTCQCLSSKKDGFDDLDDEHEDGALDEGLLGSVEVRELGIPRRVERLDDLNEDEIRLIAEFKRELVAESCEDDLEDLTVWPLHRFVQCIYSRNRSAKDAAKLWMQHIKRTERLGIRDIQENRVREMYRQGFCVLSGCDKKGRPMVWVRVKYMQVRVIGAATAIRNTWMCLDAVLQDVDANRSGICFVYDLDGLNQANITLNVRDITNVLHSIGFAHPSNIAKVVFINPPTLFWYPFQVAKAVMPAHLKELITPMSTQSRSWYNQLCYKRELPGYLGGAYPTPEDDYDGYYTWMCQRLHGWELPYRGDDLAE